MWEQASKYQNILCDICKIYTISDNGTDKLNKHNRNVLLLLTAKHA